MSKLKEINIHITDFCNGHCPMCYITSEDMPRTHGDLETLKLIIHNAIVNGEVERFIMVGGDPCEYPHLVELLKFIKAESKKYDVKTRTIVLSNTHDYRENGKIVDIESILDYIDEMDVTIHGSTAEEHDNFNGVPGSYNHVMENIRHFAEVKRKDQDICAVINVMPHTVAHMEEIMLSAAAKMKGFLSAFVIQRIAPSGRADGEVKWFIEKQDMDPLMKIFDKIIKEGKYEIEFCDVFPWCSVKPEYRYMLPKGGCNWGDEVCAVYYDGTVKRCAMASNELSKKMTELDTPEKWKTFWETDPELKAFRKKLHLDEECKNCELLQDCGGACIMARATGDPYKDDNKPIDTSTGKIKPNFLDLDSTTMEPGPLPGHDYLRRR